MADERNYLLSETDTSAKNERLGLFEAMWDPSTLSRLEKLDISPGLRCLEVGAGRGSIAQWLSSRVGPQGRVVAADIDCRLLTGLADNVEVRNLDIRHDDLEVSAYDFVHCRALLMHLPDPVAALRRMAAALRPGGLLLAEEGDYGLFTYSGHSDAEWVTHLSHRVFAALAAAKIMHPYLGRILPGLLMRVGLELLGSEVSGWVGRPGDPSFEFQRVSNEAAAPRLIAAGVLTESEQARVRAVMSCPSAVMTMAAGLACWARQIS